MKRKLLTLSLLSVIYCLRVKRIRERIIVPILRHFRKVNFTYLGSLQRYSTRLLWQWLPEQTRVPKQMRLTLTLVYFGCHVYFGSSTLAFMLLLLKQPKQRSRSRHIMSTLVYFVLSASGAAIKNKAPMKRYNYTLPKNTCLMAQHFFL